MIKTNIELVELAKKVATSFKTLYVLGCFGAPMNEDNKQRYTNNLDYNRQDSRKLKILQSSFDTFGFDCVCFVKGLLWGWVGDVNHEYGGATYQSNGVPDIGSNSMIEHCIDVSQDFSKIQIGELVWIDGHDGIYVGDGIVVECTHRWNDGVQFTRAHNILPHDGSPGRKWDKHGKLPWITYVEAEEPKKDTDSRISLRVIDDKSKGDDVRAMQILLEANGCKGEMNPFLYGSSGKKTVAAIKMFQEKAGIPVTGRCDKATWEKLLGV